MSEKQYNSFRDNLIAQDKTDTKMHNNFQLEANKMYTEKLKMNQRFAFVVGSGMIAFLMLIFWAFSKMYEELQIEHATAYLEPVRLTSVWAMLVSAMMVILLLWPAIRGKVGLRFYPKILRFVFWFLILAIVALFFSAFNLIEKQTNEFDATEISWIATVMVLVVVMGVYLLLSDRSDRSDIRNKTKILELEHRLIELEEKLNLTSAKPSTDS
ncbi:MAG: hypothetical protein ACYSUT_01095 [Planctomycetota bacterium]|jgi:uncharacterized membrane protein